MNFLDVFPKKNKMKLVPGFKNDILLKMHFTGVFSASEGRRENLLLFFLSPILQPFHLVKPPAASVANVNKYVCQFEGVTTTLESDLVKCSWGEVFN